MSTDRNKMEATLRQLQAELAESPDIDPAVKERLLAMQAEILSSLQSSAASPGESNAPAKSTESPGATPAAPASLTRRLTDAALYFEESHPSLSTTISSLAGILGQMGF